MCWIEVIMVKLTSPFLQTVSETDSAWLRGCSHEKPVRMYRKQDGGWGKAGERCGLGADSTRPDPAGSSGAEGAPELSPVEKSMGFYTEVTAG